MAAGLALSLFALAEVAGWKFYKETRGGVVQCVVQKPGDREPWTAFRDADRRRSLYEATTWEEAARIGFWGTLPPDVSRDRGAMWLLVDALEAEGWKWAIRHTEVDPTHSQVTFWYPERPSPNGAAVNASATAEAVAKAALKARQLAVSWRAEAVEAPGSAG